MMSTRAPGYLFSITVSLPVPLAKEDAHLFQFHVPPGSSDRSNTRTFFPSLFDMLYRTSMVSLEITSIREQRTDGLPSFRRIRRPQ